MDFNISRREIDYLKVYVPEVSLCFRAIPLKISKCYLKNDPPLILDSLP